MKLAADPRASGRPTIETAPRGQGESAEAGEIPSTLAGVQALRRSREEIHQALIRVEWTERACGLIGFLALLITALSIAMPALACAVLALVLR